MKFSSTFIGYLLFTHCQNGSQQALNCLLKQIGVSLKTIKRLKKNKIFKSPLKDLEKHYTPLNCSQHGLKTTSAKDS